MREVALAALLVLGLLAGCAGEPDTDAPDPESVDYPDGFGQEGITDTETASETHRQSLEEPYRVAFRLRQIDARGAVTTTGNVSVRPDDRRYHVEVDQRAATKTRGYERYYVDDAVYVRTSSAQESEYEQRNESFSRPVYADRETFVTMLADLSLNATEVRVENGTELVVYRVTNVSSPRMGSTTEAANGTVVVDTTGTIRSINISFTRTSQGMDRETTFRYDVTTEADVEIERPGWIDLAETADSAQK